MVQPAGITKGDKQWIDTLCDYELVDTSQEKVSTMEYGVRSKIQIGERLRRSSVVQ